MTSPITEQARQVDSIATHEKPAGLNNPRASAVLGPFSRRIHIFGVELGSPQAALHEAAGLGLLTSEAIYDPETGTLDQIDGSVVSLFSNQAPNIAGPDQVQPSPG